MNIKSKNVISSVQKKISYSFYLLGYLITCIIERCSKAAKFAADVKYPPHDDPGNQKLKNLADSLIAIILSSNCDIGLGFSSFDISCKTSISILKTPKSA